MPKRKRESQQSTTMVKRRKKIHVRRRRLRRPIPRGPFPISRIAKLKLATPMMTLTATSGNLASLDVFANWPVYGSRNAYGWDQWATLYNYCVVLGSKITLYQSGDVEQTSGTVNSVLVGGIYLSDDTTNFTNYQELVEARRGRMYRPSEAFGTSRKCKNTFSAKKFFNIKDVKDNMSRLGAPVASSSPSDSAIYKCWMQPIDTSTTREIRCNAIIDYICLFSEPKDVAPS